MRKRNQAQQIIDYLARGRTLTTLQALRKFGSLRLGARIWDLREAGHRITADIVRVRSGAHVARYRLLRASPAR